MWSLRPGRKFDNTDENADVGRLASQAGQNMSSCQTACLSVSQLRGVQPTGGEAEASEEVQAAAKAGAAASGSILADMLETTTTTRTTRAAAAQTTGGDTAVGVPPSFEAAAA